MKQTFFLEALGIIALSLVLNWLVQLGYYLFRWHSDRQAFASQRTLLNYYTGYLGDGIIVPLINVLIFYIIVRTGVKFSLPVVEFCLGAGLTLDAVAHYLQGKLKLVNWSMPKPFHWNFAGYWHMVSFPIQMGYLVFFAWVSYANWLFLWSTLETKFALVAIFSLMLLFVILYLQDNHWLPWRLIAKLKLKPLGKLRFI